MDVAMAGTLSLTLATLTFAVVNADFHEAGRRDL